MFRTLKVGLHPTGLAKDAWNVEKFIKVQAAKKKFDIKGAIALSSPENLTTCQLVDYFLTYLKEISVIPIKMNATAIMNVKTYPLMGSLFFPKPLANHSIFGYNLSLQSAWNTFGADTNDAKADDRVAAKHPA